jgi:uncharacterized membrane protein SpoIIM required for sporulation
MMFIGMFYSSISILLSAWLFPDHTSLVMVFFTVLSCLYVVQGAIMHEESIERSYKTEFWILKHHSRLLIFLLFLFLGFVFSYAFWSFFLPTESANNIFGLQEAVVDGIRTSSIKGDFTNSNEAIFAILSNNLKVTILSLVLAFFYGAGAIFVLVWNASVMGLVIGNLAKAKFGILGLPIAFTKYFVHGIPEMLAYLVVAIAGGIIYTAVWKGDFLKYGRPKKIFIDVIILIFISLLLLVFAALIEVYISPYI